jgi:hypothetical protein
VPAGARFGEHDAIPVPLRQFAGREAVRGGFGGRQREAEQEGEKPVRRDLQGAGRLRGSAPGRQAGAGGDLRTGA